jgi:phosphopantothenoylcysteine decarboxylase/phosphopantothenate--cysteine ligase
MSAAGPARPQVLLGVGGGIAAYKACELLRLFTEGGADVRVVPTVSALEFVGAATWAALSGRPVAIDVWSDVHEVPHVRLGRAADLVVVAPATADLMARAAAGRADDLLTATLLTVRCPVLYAPAMHTEMWEHPATRENVATLRRRGALVLDPVLFLGNRSSGRQGYALATTALARGAEVVLVAANVDLPDPAGAKVVRVGSAVELRAAVRVAAPSADVVVMAAAVADFRPAAPVGAKIKKTDAEPDPVPLVRNPDVLAELCAERARPGQVIVGFAAETGDASGDVLHHGRAKLARKRCDLLVVNEVGETLGFGTPDNQAVVLGLDGSVTAVPRGPKEALADVVWDLALARL